MIDAPALTPEPRVVALTGATAVGKSAVALRLAELLKGEIISVDSMQVYRGLDIGTAKPSTEDRSRIPHHLIDVLDLWASFDASQFVGLANLAVKDILARGRLPILCGGTGLYLKAFFDGLGEAPAGNLALRAELEATPITELLRELAERDPATSDRIDKRNSRRVVRALEVIRLTGKPYSLQKASWHRSLPPGSPAPLIFGLNRPAADLHRRIEDRVEAMFRKGLVAETAALLERGLRDNRTALQAIGYRQVVEHLDGVRPLPESIALVKTRTRQFAKRQMTWFRRQLPIRWVEAGPNSADKVAEELANIIRAEQVSRKSRNIHSP